MQLSQNTNCSCIATSTKQHWVRPTASKHIVQTHISNANTTRLATNQGLSLEEVEGGGMQNSSHFCGNDSPACLQLGVSKRQLKMPLVGFTSNAEGLYTGVYYTTSHVSYYSITYIYTSITPASCNANPPSPTAVFWELAPLGDKNTIVSAVRQLQCSHHSWHIYTMQVESFLLQELTETVLFTFG